MSLALATAAACAPDPMERSDGIFPAAGWAPRHNVRVHTVDPSAGYRGGPNPGGSGPRAAVVIGRYHEGASPAGEPGLAEGGELGEGSAVGTPE